MSNGMKAGWQAWVHSLRVLARSLAYVFAWAAIAGLWGFAAYERLWLPESSAWVLALALVWVLALAWLAVGLLAGTLTSVSAVAAGMERRLTMRSILCFQTRRWGRTALAALAAGAAIFILDELFGWINGLALTVASFLTFHAQHPVSHELIGEIPTVIESLVWVFLAGLAMTRLLTFLNPRDPARQSAPSRPPRRFFVFLTGVLSSIVFGGLAWLLATWNPVVQAGGWDYAQLVLRNGAALLLLTVGWLFWALTLSWVALSPLTEPAASPPSH